MEEPLSEAESVRRFVGLRLPGLHVALPALQAVEAGVVDGPLRVLRPGPAKRTTAPNAAIGAERRSS